MQELPCMLDSMMVCKHVWAQDSISQFFHIKSWIMRNLNKKCWRFYDLDPPEVSTEGMNCHPWSRTTSLSHCSPKYTPICCSWEKGGPQEQHGREYEVCSRRGRLTKKSPFLKMLLTRECSYLGLNEYFGVHIAWPYILNNNIPCTFSGQTCFLFQLRKRSGLCLLPEIININHVKRVIQG